jgi:hypothetical protein
MCPNKIEMDEQTKQFLKQDNAIPEEIDIRRRKFYPKEYKADGFKGVVWKGLDEYEGEVALKFTVYEDYMERSFLDEAKMARKLKGQGSFADFIDVGLAEIELPEKGKTKFVCFIEEWIDGQTLSEYLGKNEINASFLVSYVGGMCNAIKVLNDLHLQHDDLRPANVMIKPNTLTKELLIKIIDTGSLKPSDNTTKKEKDDHIWFAEHLITIWNIIKKNKQMSLPEKRFLKETKPLLDRMIEDDRTVALWIPSKIKNEFDSAYTRSQTPPDKIPELSNPFDYITAEHIQSDKVLVDLFAESCPWFGEVAGPNPLLLTGPRGCGKSMVFRRLSVKALLYKIPSAIVDSKIVGFYISCSADLRNRFSWIKTDNIARKFQREIIHYFNLLLAREVIQTFQNVSKREDREKLFGFGESQEQSFHKLLMNKLRVTEAESFYLQGVSYMQHALEIVESKMDYCYNQMINGRGIGEEATDNTFLATLTRFLSKTISFCSERKTTFLIDDFSIHRITEPVQKILNPIIWDRQTTHVFKLSSEKYGAVGVDELAAVAEVTRELREIDCGQFYINLGDKDCRRFAKELLAKRLCICGYKGTPEQILGNSKYEEGSLGKSLRARAKKPGRIDNQYYGLETIADICSGDISNLLEIYRRIFESGGVLTDTEKMVPSHIQHEAIGSVSRDLLNLIKNYVPCGKDMYNIVYHFGILSRQILREGRLQKKGKDMIPSETSRIEVDQPPGQSKEELTEQQQELMDELVRRAIFIEMESGRARHKFTPTLRWQLRRVYCPAFGASLAKNTAIKWTPEEFKRFLIDPENACESEFKKRWGSENPPDNHPVLF